ncbi:MAG: Crp/Fnr family transcriptional regulator [Bacteroidota bacterium]
MTAQQKVFDFFNSQFPFHQEGLQEFTQAFQSKQYRKGQILKAAEDVENRLRFLESGTVRAFYAHEDKEMNTSFFVRPQFMTDFHAFMQASSNNKYLECLTDVKLLEMRKPTFDQFMDSYSCGKDFVEQIFQRIIAEKEKEAFKHFSMTPDELYLDLLQNRPDWFQHVPLYHIASYLRMTPETLSRIRKRSKVS